VGQVDLSRLHERFTLQITATDPPPGAKPIRVIYASSTGFEPLGLIPIWRVQFDECLEQLAAKASELGADGVSNLASYYRPTFVFDLFGLWAPWLQVYGMAWRSS
jgi:hypothetical protein